MLRKKLALLLLTVSPAIFAQDAAPTPTETTPAPAKEFVKKTFENGVVINNQTIEGPAKKGLDFMIQHRFGNIENGKDLFGIFGAANIRLGLNYGFCKRFSVGIGATKDNHQYDLEWKYAILKQTKESGMPVSLSYYGNVYIRAGANGNFINQENKYTAANRCHFFNEIMVARKFNNNFSMQLGASYTYLNYVADSTLTHGFIGIHAVASYRINVMSSIQVEYDMNLNPDKVPDITDATKKVTYQKPNLSIGYEVSTGQHQFQIFVGTGNGIAGTDIISANTNDFTKKNSLLIGFNITRQFDFN